MFTEPKVVLAVDLITPCEHAIDIAASLADARGATLEIVHVMPLSASSGVEALQTSVDVWSGARWSRLAQLWPSDPGVPCRHVLLVGDPEEEIAALVARDGAELLVLVSSPRAGLRRLSLRRGLTARLQSRLSCPIVLSPARGAAAAALRRVPQPDRFTALERMLDARVCALNAWMRAQREVVEALARRPAVTRGVATLCAPTRGRGPWSSPARARAQLGAELDAWGEASGAAGVQVMTRDATLYARGVYPAPHDETLRLTVARALERGAHVSTPTRAHTARQEPVVLAAARIASTRDEAVVVCAFDARRDFLRVLARPGPTPSAETYAFDAHGLMLSYSHFADQLRQIGLLPSDPGARAAQRLRVCDPGANLLTGAAPASDARPLTRMAAAATRGRDGSDRRGYRDYRGVPVIGAWRWLDEHGFGVAAEMDLAHA